MVEKTWKKRSPGRKRECWDIRMKWNTHARINSVVTCKIKISFQRCPYGFHTHNIYTFRRLFVTTIFILSVESFGFQHQIISNLMNKNLNLNAWSMVLSMISTQSSKWSENRPHAMAFIKTVNFWAIVYLSVHLIVILSSNSFAWNDVLCNC